MDLGDSEGGRVVSVDIIRGCALVGMVLDHFQLYFGNDAAAGSWPYFLFEHALGDWGAACFLMIMGMSQALSHEKHKVSGPGPLLHRALLRGGYLFVVGLLMLGLTWGPSQLWQWDILTLMGFATVVLALCRFLPSWTILLLGSGLAVGAPLLRTVSCFADYWGGALRGVPLISEFLPGLYVEPVSKYEVVWSVKPIILGFLANGYFPLLPWLLFPLVGFALGRRIAGGKMRGDLPRLALLGAALAAAGLALAFAARMAPAEAVTGGFIAPLSFSPDSSSMVLFQAGMTLFFFSALFFLCDTRQNGRPPQGLLARQIGLTSRFSLSFYVLHYLIIGWTLFAVYLATDRYPISSLMGDVPALLCGLVAVLALETVLWLWQRTGGKYSLEWVLDALTARLAAHR